ncbi:RNA polymerase sigma-70 factor [Pedobacter sp. BS3]|uniref:RNA polymerase sigma-70 factor n=1 Tax=Pedobacter sp. BS3 TaxID=2567937 RepID=UPI0011F04FBF|nr:RNA polymerase sigma-70 factor [Pedobacter sp. BS3]TZF83883.1 RNA polymerase sigma-70 factor [Pedobacter sp. BS3]
MMPHSDNELFELWKGGNERCFQELFSRHFVRLYKFAARHFRDDGYAEETVMDIFFSVWRRRESIQLNGPFDQYLYKALKNRIIDHYRRPAPVTASFTDLPDSQYCTNSVEDILVDKELNLIYRQALEKLSPQRRTVYELSRIQGLSHREIAARLGLSVNTVENHISASLRFLRAYLRQNDLVTFLSLLLVNYFL